MFVALAQVLDLAVAPLTWALACLVVTALAWWRRPRLAQGAAGTAFVVLAAFSSPRVANAVVRFTERDARRTQRPGLVYDAVIVLGGALDVASTRATGELELNAAAERLLRGWEVVRAGQARYVLVSGGVVAPVPGDVPESEILVRQLVAWGVPVGRAVSETRSRNTHENAVESARIASERGWNRLLLVTSAAHMPRALGCFRQVGLSPDALPVDFRGGDGRGESWLPRAAALDASTAALRELAGRVVYRLLGYSTP